MHTIDFMKDEIELKDYLMLRSLVVSVAIIGGAVSAMIFDFFDVSLNIMLLFLASLGLFTIIMEYKLYSMFKNITK